MLNLPEWQKIMVEISKGRNNKNQWKGSYSKAILNELELQGLIEIERDIIKLTEKGSKGIVGVYGFLERI